MNNKIERILLFTGLIGAITGGIGYILIIVAIVLGFETDLSMQQQILIAVVGAVDGILINIALRYQGIALAKELPESKDINARYQKIINYDKEPKVYKLIGWFMGWAIVRDIIFKGITVSLTTYLVIFAFVEGNGDYSLFLVALANLLLFAGFGTMGLSGMYKKYVDEHLPALHGLCNKLDQMGSIPSEGKE